MEPSHDTRTCRVCGDKAVSCNFGAITCESCKAFFRRNGKRELPQHCQGTCEINFRTRAHCRTCRLKKCFDIGMKAELILTEEEREARMGKIIKNRQLKRQLDKSEEPQSSTVSEESNQNMTSQAKLEDSTINQVSTSEVVQQEEPCRTPYPMYQSCISEQEYRTLPPHLAQLAHDLTDGARNSMDLPIAKVVELPDYNKCFDQQEITVFIIVRFAKKLPCFAAIPQEDKVILLQQCMFEAVNFLSSRAFDPLVDGWHVYTNNDENMVTNTAAVLDTTPEGQACRNVYRDYALTVHSVTLRDPAINLILLAIIIFTPQRSPNNFHSWDAIQEVKSQLHELLERITTLRYPPSRVKVQNLFKLLHTTKKLQEAYDAAFKHVNPNEVSPVVKELLKPT